MPALSAQETQDIQAAMRAGRLPNPTIVRFADRATHLVFADLAGVRGMRGPWLAGLLRDVTAQSGAGWQQLIPVLKTAGELDFELLFDDTHQALLEASLEQSEELFQIRLTDNINVQFKAFVSLEFQAPVVGALKARVHLKISDQASLLAG